MPKSPAAPRRRLVLAAMVALAALLAGLPAAAYTIYLKDGSSINAEKKWEEVDGQAVITLPGGTRSTIALEEIDVERTLRANRENLGTAQIIDGPNPRTQPPEERQETTLGDLIQQRRQEEGRPPEAPARRQAPGAGPPPALPATAAGYPDLMAFERRPFRDMDLAEDLKGFFTNQGLDQAMIFVGTEPGRPLVEVTTNSEASVFRALAVACSALATLRDRGSELPALELVLVTPSRERGGQFLITPQMADDLLSSRIDISTFFLQNVQF